MLRSVTIRILPTPAAFIKPWETHTTR